MSDLKKLFIAALLLAAMFFLVAWINEKELSMKSNAQLLSDNDENISLILNEREENLKNFLFDRANEEDIANVKALVSFTLSNHYALLSMEE